MNNFIIPFTVRAQDRIHNLSQSQLDEYNPLKGSGAFGGSSPTLGQILSRALSFVFPLAAVILFVILIWGGIQMMSGGMSGKDQGIKDGRGRIMAALIGFGIVLGAYTIMLLIQAVLGIEIL